MSTLMKIAMLSLLSLSTALIATTQAKADEKDGTIERFTCLDLGVPDGHLKGTYVKLNASDQGKKLGFGGGDMALKLSNDGLNSGTLYTGTGAAGTFVLQKKESQFQIYYKPGKVNPGNCRVYICFKQEITPNPTPNPGKPEPIFKPGYLIGSLGGFNQTKVGGGWFTCSDDLDSFGYRGAIIERISVVLNARGDDGNLLVGNMQVFSHKDLLDPSTLIMEEAPCAPKMTCNAFVQQP